MACLWAGPTSAMKVALPNGFSPWSGSRCRRPAAMQARYDPRSLTPRGKLCKGMAGLVEEGKEIMQEDGDDAVIDAALISAAQRVEHYEIAAYGCLVTYAQLLGLGKSADLLKQNLAEEEAADKALTRARRAGHQPAPRCRRRGERRGRVAGAAIRRGRAPEARARFAASPPGLVCSGIVRSAGSVAAIAGGCPAARFRSSSAIRPSGSAAPTAAASGA